MKNILVLCSGYPSVDNPYNCTWAHTRNRYYVLSGLVVHVFRMDEPDCYSLDGVEVVSYKKMKNNLASGRYDLVLSHSPNIRKHIPILSKVKDINIVLFIHGSESMAIERDYPEPYFYMRTPFYKKFARICYDELKFKVLSRFIRDNKKRVTLVFVSDWMRGVFERNVLNPVQDDVSYEVINNSLNERFLIDGFNPNADKVGDFITLRRLDFSKFAIDLVVEFANANPGYKFDVYGRGRYFKFNDKPDNVRLYDKHIQQDEIPALLNEYRCALMPTRCDAQGVMACEIASFGMPLVTSDIAVNREMFSGFSNVILWDNDNFGKKIESGFFDITDFPRCDRFSHEKTLFRELKLI